MTKMSVQAEELNRGGMRINQFYRGDYVGFEIVKAVISATVLFGVLVAAYAVFRFDDLLNEFYSGAGLEGIRKYILLYLVLVAVYALVAYVLYSVRYNRSRKKAREYYNNLRKLEKKHS